MIKNCSWCKQDLPVENFRKRLDKWKNPTLIFSWCKSCENQKSREQYEKHKARKDAQNKRWYEENKKSRLISQYAWAKKNKDKIAKIQKKHRRSNLAKDCAKVSLRRAKKIQATPFWANLNIIQCYYSVSAMLNREGEIKYHVDHIIPLNGKNVCGLHNEFNLRVIPAIQNMKKGNKLCV